MAKLTFKMAAMNSGKSTQLIQLHYNFRERGLNPIVFTQSIDDRAGVGKIEARVGLSIDAIPIYPDTDIFEIVDESYDVVIVDEGQFLSKSHVMQLVKVVDELSIPCIVYGLKTDFTGKLFEGSKALIEMADRIEELKTACWCGDTARFNARLDGDGNVITAGDVVEIGGNERYVALCRKHFLSGDVNTKQRFS